MEEEEQLRRQRHAVAEIIAGTQEEIAKYSLEKKALLSLKRHWARGQALDYLGQDGRRKEENSAREEEEEEEEEDQKSSP